MKKPLVLTIMDGFGFNPVKEVNAIDAAKTPNLDKIFEEDNIEYSINYVEAIDIVKDCVVKAQALTIEHLLGIIIKKLHASFEGKLMGVHVRIRKPEILTETKNLGVCATRFF